MNEIQNDFFNETVSVKRSIVPVWRIEEMIFHILFATAYTHRDKIDANEIEYVSIEKQLRCFRTQRLQIFYMKS